MEPPPNAFSASPSELQLSARALRDLAFGSVRPSFITTCAKANAVGLAQAAGMVSKVFEHPFDLCKVRLQTQVLDHTARFAGPLDCLSQTWRNEGIRGLYRVCIFQLPHPGLSPGRGSRPRPPQLRPRQPVFVSRRWLM